MLILAWFS